MHDRNLTVAARVRGFFHTLAAHRWAAPCARLAAFGVGLVVLAAIGRAASAGPLRAEPQLMTVEAASIPTTSMAGDAGASPPVQPAPPPTPPAATERCASVAPHERATPEDPVILNTATSDDLHRLPGVGDKRAQAILDLRAKLGRFHQVEDLLRVKGIGRASIRRLRPLVRIDPPVTPAITGAAAAPPSSAGAATSRDAPPARTP